MRLGVLVAILGEVPELRDRICLPRPVQQDERAKSGDPAIAHRSSLIVHRSLKITRK